MTAISFSPERRQLLQAFVQAEILEAIDADLDPEERAELLVHPRHEALAVDAEHVMAMVEFLQHRVQFAAESLVLAHAEDLGDDVGRQAEHPQLARALEDLVDRKMAAEHEIPAVLDLVQGVGAPQVDRRPVLLGELRPEHQRPVIQPLANHLGIEPVGGRLQRLQIGRPEERVIVLAEADPVALEFARR